jgi:hypothetical protein
MDRTSQALAEALIADERRSYRVIAEESNVPRSTLRRQKHGGVSNEAKAQLLLVY